jgi:hypothetical protein
MANRNTPVMRVVVIVGALIGFAIEWLCMAQPDRRLFVAAFAGAWVAMGVAAVMTADLSIAGDSISSDFRYGKGARVLGKL